MLNKIAAFDGKLTFETLQVEGVEENDGLLFTYSQEIEIWRAYLL